MNERKFWTARYAVINIAYFMAFGGIHAYASVFLLNKGFLNSEIGLLFALSNVLSVVVQPLIAGWIDKQGRLTNRNVSAAITVTLIVLSGVLLVVGNRKAVIFAVFLIMYMIQMACQPLIIAMNFEYTQAGCDINFGLARGMGSMGFAVYSLIMGNLLEKTDVNMIPVLNILILTVELIFILTFIRPENRTVQKKDDAENIKDLAHNNFLKFAKHYPGYMLFLVATVCFFFSHGVLNDYLIQIITPLGGTEKHVGYALFTASVLELPAMALFGRISGKINYKVLLKLSGIFFTVKITVMLLAVNITGVFISEAFQFCAYAMFVPASACYVSEVMGKYDQVEGQAFINVAITLSGVFTGLTCGRILDSAGPKPMLLLGTGVCFIGAVIGILVIGKTTLGSVKASDV